MRHKWMLKVDYYDNYSYLLAAYGVFRTRCEARLFIKKKYPDGRKLVFKKLYPVKVSVKYTEI